MAEQELDRAQIGARFDQMRGETMAERVGRDVLVEPSAPGGCQACLVNCASADGAPSLTTREQPISWARRLTVGVQEGQDALCVDGARLRIRISSIIMRRKGVIAGLLSRQIGR